ncbi:MAG: hypothetical protein HC916_15780 [Coleofasciculaceae cyanobacterium SM2_1_6]|nr:hypothetical protein [Coleofasciculaceae cyanobacterium SM2_1_6]
MNIILGLFFGVLIVSPWVLILWGAIERFGLISRLWFIPLGAIAGAVVLGIGGACLYEFLNMLEDRRTGLPESGSFGGLGRGIFALIILLVGGWIGSIGGAWLVANFWLVS